MAKIELAYNTEIGENLTASEANERYLEGILTDQRAFHCSGTNCELGLTCKSMFTNPKTRKQTPCYIKSNQQEEHSPDCEIGKEITKVNRDRGRKTGKESVSGQCNTVCFHMTRPESHMKTFVTKNTDKNAANCREKREEYQKQNSNRKHISQYFWLYTLMTEYYSWLKEGGMSDAFALLDLGKGNIKKYRFEQLFQRIKKVHSEEEDKRYYVYYGKGRVFARKDGGYDLVFKERFMGSEKKVKCVIMQELIKKCKYGRKHKVAILEENKGKEVFIFVLAQKNDKQEYSNVYLNVNNLDHIAVWDIDIDNL